MRTIQSIKNQYKTSERGAVDVQAIRRGALLIFAIASAVIFVVSFVTALT